MIDKTRVPAAKGTLPSFAPVPRHYNRHDGWTPVRQQGFIEALADLGSVKAAAHAVNMTPEGAYQLRRHPEAGEFRKAWEAALACGVQRLEDIAMDRALNGVEVPVYCYGKLIGTRLWYNDRLLMFMLRNRAPKRFAADNWQPDGAVTPDKLRRMRAQWRKEWEDEQEKNAPSPEDIHASIGQKMEAMRERILARRQREFDEASEKTQKLYLAWQESNREDIEARERAGLPARIADARPDRADDEAEG